MLIDCRSLESRPVPLPEEVGILVVNTGVRHELAHSEYPKRRAECREAANLLGVESLREAALDSLAHCLAGEERVTIRNRAEHVVREIVRTREFSEALAANDLGTAGAMMRASHDSLRDLFEVSCAELDVLVAIGREMSDVIGCRMTGGGFGGSAVFMVAKPAMDSVAREIQSSYHEKTGIAAEALRVSPVGGALALDPGLIQDRRAAAP